MAKYVGRIHKILQRTDQEVQRRCLFRDENGRQCKNGSIGSHSIQRNGPLKKISEDGHVIKCGPLLKARPIEMRQNFERVGVSKASTFHGFCNEHDANLFKEIEIDEIVPSNRLALMLDIRALAMELYRKHQMVEIQRQTIEEFSNDRPPQDFELARLILKGASLAIEENTKKLENLFRQYHRKPRGNRRYVFFTFSQDLPFSCTGAFEPEWDLNRRWLFRKDRSKLKWNSCIVFVGSIKTKSIAYVGATQMYRDHRVDRFIDSVGACNLDAASALLTVAAAHSENLFLRPSWFSSLDETHVGTLSQLVQSGAFSEVKDPHILNSRIPIREVETEEVFRSQLQ